MDNTIKVLITGDFYGGYRIEKLIQLEKYDEIFNDFLPLVKDSDIAITNLESALTLSDKPISKTGPSIKASAKTIEALKFAGFNLLTLANNHIMDYGVSGLKNTIDICKSYGIDFTGVGLNIKEASQIFYKEVKGKKLAFINIAENEWSTTLGTEPGANPLNPVTNYYAIQEARLNADFVFVIVHGGHEMYQLPSPRMKQTYRFFIDAGASAVIGHHTHCYSGYEVYKECPIFYSLGNFIFEWPTFQKLNWSSGYSVKFKIKGDKLFFELLPTEMCNSNTGVRKLKTEFSEHFYKDMDRLQNIISDDKELADNFEDYCLKSGKVYNAYIEPHSNRFLYALQNRGFLPSILSSHKRLLYSNLIKCESHRDVLLKVIKKKK